ncbi:MAG: hypothetical protein ACOC44_13750 [Promethearchaeia archaeon]
MSPPSDTQPKTGFEKIVEFFNTQIEKNNPVGITEIVDYTELSWTYVKRVLTDDLKNDYVGFHLKKSGNTWIAWKDRDNIVKKLEHTCGEMLEENK